VGVVFVLLAVAAFGLAPHPLLSGPRLFPGADSRDCLRHRPCRLAARRVGHAGQIGGASLLWLPLVRVPSTYAGRAVPSGGCRPPDHPAPAFSRRPRAPKPGVAAPLRFFAYAPCASRLFACAPFASRSWGVEAPPVRVIRGRSFFQAAHVPGPHPGRSRDLAGRLRRFARQRPWDSLTPFAVFIRLARVGGASSARRARAHMPFRLVARREFPRARGPLFGAGHGPSAAAPGLRSRGPAVPFRPPAPPWLLRGGPDRIARPGLPWAFVFLSQVFGRRPPATASGDSSARGVCACVRRVVPAVTGPRRGVARSLRRCEGPTPSRSGGVSARTGVPV
jgi:hypothetical protein